ncbi:LruC domain-containing protein [uncultured Algoriphagus sp.]|uniref:LruC domain-containing protein n=1 Tax=uncultured Algoriphagus sp. TaxID=417365 RepID=UPI0025977845|nr:LruC domain-containing protein [uncultured Algoriphagus sp.]
MRKLLILGSVLGLMSSCIQENESSILGPDTINQNTLVAPDGFNFDLSANTDFDITVKLIGGEPFAYGGFDILTEYPDLDDPQSIKDNTIASITLDKNGRYQNTIYMAKNYETLYLFNHSGGVEPVIKLNRLGNNFILDHQPSTPEVSSRQANMRMTNTWYTTLGSWYSSGYPTYLSNNKFISAVTMAHISRIFRNDVALNNNYKPWNYGNGNTDVSIDTGSQPQFIDITYIRSIAGNKNTLGYYYYSKEDGHPANLSTVDRTIIYPNLQGTSSALVAGNTVRLVGPNEDGSFPPNYMVSFFLVEDGYDQSNGTIKTGNNIYYSRQTNNGGDQLRFVRLYDEISNSLIFGVEDFNNPDWDYDDVIFTASLSNSFIIPESESSPRYLSSTSPTPPSEDIIYYPSAAGKERMMFEDSWPRLGDGDFNDIVIDYRYSVMASQTPVSDGNKYLSRVHVEMWFVLSDAAQKNGLGILFPNIPSGSVREVRRDRESIDDEAYTGGWSIEPGHTDETVIIISEDDFTKSFWVSPLAKGKGCFNTDREGCESGTPVKASFTLLLDTQARLSGLFENISPFLIAGGNRGKEIHAAGRRPSELADESYFGLESDDTNGTDKFFKAKNNNMPWAISVPTDIPVPKNGMHIGETYMDFSSWALSNGSNNSNWYNIPDRRVSEKLNNNPNIVDYD